METKNVTLTLDKAKEFYNSDNAALKEIALQAFTKEELTTPKYTDIKTFEDACKALGLNMAYVSCSLCNMDSIEGSFEEHLMATYKLDIIRKALNEDWKPSLVQGSIYYPYVRFYPAGHKAREAASSNNWKLGKSFITDGKKYTLVCGDSYYCNYGGLTNSSCGSSVVQPYLSLLGCKSKEIAEHMSRYFSKEIFEATYAQHINTYEWID